MSTNASGDMPQGSSPSKLDELRALLRVTEARMEQHYLAIISKLETIRMLDDLISTRRTFDDADEPPREDGRL